MKDKVRARNRKAAENDLRKRLNQTKVNYKTLFNDNKELRKQLKEVLDGFDQVNKSIDSWLGAAVRATGKDSMILKKSDLVKKYAVAQIKQENGDYLIKVEEI